MAQSLDTSRVPGTVVAHYPKTSGKYVGSPGIAIVGDGVYLAKHDEFGPQSSEWTAAITHLYRSTDRGESWKRTHTFEGMFWASIFTLDDAIYMLGTDKHHGNVVIVRSRDGGNTWTKPVDAQSGLLLEGEYHTAPVPIVVRNGRAWRAIEDAGGGDKWGQRYRAMMMSAAVDADLLKANSWTTSNYLARDPKLLGGQFNAWLEGNAVVTPEDTVANILRVDYGPGNVAAIVRVSKDGREVSFDAKRDFIQFPGGATKFTIRYDPKANLYWTLSNYTPDFHHDTRAASTRNTLALASSPDLCRWTVRCVVLYHPDAVTHAFQYADWQFEGDDLIVASRTAYEDGLGGADRSHDANFLTFHWVKDFRNLEMSESSRAYLKRVRKVR
jgi:hypothetical protein